MHDPYGPDILSQARPHRRAIAEVAVETGLIVEVASDGFVGAVVGCSTDSVTLRDRRGRERRFGLHPGAFLVDDRPVTLQPPASEPRADGGVATTASGSVAVPDARARVARASRIYVEGVHDAELLERVWGEDLRLEGIVVEPLHGADDLGALVEAFGPSPSRRLGVLLDHLVPGSKESRLAEKVTDPDVLVTGHPYVDVWAAVRPGSVGIEAWPEVPMDEVWKEGVARRLGYTEAAALWHAIRGSVRGWGDLEQPLIAAVESLIDFVSLGD